MKLSPSSLLSPPPSPLVVPSLSPQVGVRAGQYKGGGLEAMEHVSKYNEIARIASDLKKAPMWVGSSFRNLES